MPREYLMVVVVFVLSLLELYCLIKFCFCKVMSQKHSGSKKMTRKVEIANKMLKATDWEFAIVMIIKVMIENELGIPKTMPAMWFVDMILMNVAVVELIIKYGLRRNNKV